MILRILFSLLLTLFIVFELQAGQCSGVFPDGVQNNNATGGITIKYGAQVNNSPDNILASNKEIKDTSGGISCGTVNCTNSGSISAAINYPTPANSNNNVLVPYSQTQGISPGNYHNITVNSSAVLNLAPGDYYLSGELSVGNASKLNIVGAGTVRIFAKKQVRFSDSTEINHGGDATGLLVYSQNNINVVSNTKISAFIYSVRDVSIGSNAVVTGAVSGKNVTLESPATVNFVNSVPKFGDFCDEGVDHFEIIHDGQGLTCEAENIIIRACADAACSSLNYDDNEVELLINGVSNKFVTVTGGSLNTSFAFISVGTATLSLDQDYKCENGASTSCDITFEDTGFIFGNVAGNTPIIPTQLSGKPSNVGFNSENFFLQAVKTDNTGVCAGVFPNGGDVSVNLSYTCHSDSSACTNAVVLTNNSTIRNLTTITASHDLRFDADSKAFFSLEYPDAGKLIINAQKNIDIDGLTKNFSQSSNAFVVKPFGIKMDFSQDTNRANAIALDHNGSVFKKAGERFTVSATAVQWSAGEDNNADGIADNLTSVNDNNTAQHFAAEKLALAPVLLLPNPGVLGTLTPESANSFSASVVDNNYHYDEVGIINLTAALADGNYLLAGNIYGQINNVGRFIPDNFAITNPFVGNACDNMTYMDEEAIALTYELSARNSNNVVTKNYTGNFAKSSVLLVAENNNNAIDLAPTRLTGAGTGSWAQGIYTNAVDMAPDIDLVSFIRNPTPALDGPFDNLLFGVKLTDIEKSDFIGLDMLANTAKSLSSTASQIRFGRATLSNSYGPETSPLGQVLAIEYFNGTRFVLAATDTCSQYNSANISFGSLNEVNIDVADIAVVSGSFVDGNDLPHGLTRQIVLPASGLLNRGEVQVIYQAPPWLKYNWNNIDEGADGLIYDDNPSAVATFGLFRGNDRIIYQREVNN